MKVESTSPKKKLFDNFQHHIMITVLTLLRGEIPT